MAQWQRLPSQLLKEYCQRAKRPLPKYKNIEKSSDKFKYRVILPDPKGDEQKDLFFVPPNAVKSEEQAQEEGALLALLQLTPSLPHERKLPDPYKTSWLHAIQATSLQKTNTTVSAHGPTETRPSTSNNTNNIININNNNSRTLAAATAAEVAVASTNLAFGLRTSGADQLRLREEQRQKRNARIHRHDAIRLANQNQPVFMSVRLREQIEVLLRSSAKDSDGNVVGLTLTDALDEGEFSDADNDDDDDENVDDVQAYVNHRLHSEGFTKRQARTAYQTWSSTETIADKQYLENEDNWDNVYEQCLQWLLVHLNEKQLPEGFDPRGGTLDIIVPVTAAAESEVSSFKTSEYSSNDDRAAAAHHTDLAAQLGISVKEAKLMCYSSSQKSAKSPLDVFWQTIQVAANSSALTVTGAEALHPDPDVGQKAEEAVLAEELMQEEFEALTAIFEDGCKIDNSNNGVTVVRLPLEGGNLNLEVVLRDRLYPYAPPSRVIVSGQPWPNQMGVTLHVALYQFLQDLPLGEPMIYALHSRVQDLLLLTPDGLGTESLVPFFGDWGDHDGDNNSRVAQVAPCSSNALTAQVDAPGSKCAASTSAKPQRRQRARGRNFWSLPPKETPPAKAIPAVNASMRRIREALPAAKMKDEFLTVLSRAVSVGNRVLLVTGETGSGM